jgi:hypothetical protein
MDKDRIDSLARSLGSTRSRRKVLAVLAGAFFAGAKPAREAISGTISDGLDQLSGTVSTAKAAGLDTAPHMEHVEVATRELVGQSSMFELPGTDGELAGKQKVKSRKKKRVSNETCGGPGQGCSPNGCCQNLGCNSQDTCCVPDDQPCSGSQPCCNGKTCSNGSCTNQQTSPPPPPSTTTSAKNVWTARSKLHPERVLSESRL